jgi:hypothetical protein
MNESTTQATFNSWVDIRKNKMETKKEMNDGMPEVIKQRLWVKGFKRGILFSHRN